MESVSEQRRCAAGSPWKISAAKTDRKDKCKKAGCEMANTTCAEHEWNQHKGKGNSTKMEAGRQRRRHSGMVKRELAAHRGLLTRRTRSGAANGSSQLS